MPPSEKSQLTKNENILRKMELYELKLSDHFSFSFHRIKVNFFTSFFVVKNMSVFTSKFTKKVSDEVK